jgi:hypothetical protein
VYTGKPPKRVKERLFPCEYSKPYERSSAIAVGAEPIEINCKLEMANKIARKFERKIRLVLFGILI